MQFRSNQKCNSSKCRIYSGSISAEHGYVLNKYRVEYYYKQKFTDRLSYEYNIQITITVNRVYSYICTEYNNIQMAITINRMFTDRYVLNIIYRWLLL